MNFHHHTSAAIRRSVICLLLALPLHGQATATLLHFSDYHSHALPFYTDEGERGGIARAMAYLAREKRKGALVFSGGDTINKGSPAWSDKYGCAEWSWWNGIVDAMAFGNHDADYGLGPFQKCRASATYPILSANTVGFEPYRVFTVNGIRVGVFALAGADFPTLVKVEGLAFRDPIAAAREVVEELRGKADVVVMIGHQHAEADYALARAVPGIDLIFGTHSHLERELTRIDGTQTWFISPWQYLGYISRVQLKFDGKKLVRVDGKLIPVDRRLGSNKEIERRVKRMQRALENDPAYRALFLPIGTINQAMSTQRFATFTLDVMRRVTNAEVALSTVSSFRAPLPRGTLTMEKLRDALPYDNEILVCTMTGVQVQRVLDFSASRAGTDSESYISKPATIDPKQTYRIATTEYLANIAYRDVFDCDKQNTGLRVRDQVRRAITASPSP